MSEHIEKKNPEETGEKTFTQEEVNRIVSERLGRERDKRASELEEREKAVRMRELAVIAAEKLSAAGLPKELGAVLKYEDENALEQAIQTLSHIKGFKPQEKESEFQILKPNRLPEGEAVTRTMEDRLRDAFRVHNE